MSMMVPCTTNTTHPSTVSGVCNNGTSSTNASISIVWRNETDSDIANNLTFYFQASNYNTSCDQHYNGCTADHFAVLFCSF